jgi:hypothetical protein
MGGPVKDKSDSTCFYDFLKLFDVKKMKECCDAACALYPCIIRTLSDSPMKKALNASNVKGLIDWAEPAP